MFKKQKQTVSPTLLLCIFAFAGCDDGLSNRENAEDQLVHQDTHAQLADDELTPIEEAILAQDDQESDSSLGAPSDDLADELQDDDEAELAPALDDDDSDASPEIELAQAQEDAAPAHIDDEEQDELDFRNKFEAPQLGVQVQYECKKDHIWGLGGAYKTKSAKKRARRNWRKKCRAVYHKSWCQPVGSPFYKLKKKKHGFKWWHFAAIPCRFK